MPNLFLEGFERIRGIVIATTNLIDNLDEAFSRRFHLKLEFPKPDYPMRIELWNKHMLPAIPCEGTVDFKFLSRKFEFTGGQISVAIRNASIEAAVRDAALRMSDLVSACETERQGSFGEFGGFKKGVGFHN